MVESQARPEPTNPRMSFYSAVSLHVCYWELSLVSDWGDHTPCNVVCLSDANILSYLSFFTSGLL